MPADDLITDESAWPIVVHTTIGIPSEEQVIAMLRRSDALLARRQPYAVIFDNSQAGSVPKYMRDASVRWVRDNKDELERWCRGMGLVIRSPALRFVMSTVLLVTRHAVPSEVFATRAEAFDWVDLRLRQSDR